MALSDVIARLAVSLSLETAAFEKGASKASGTANTLGGRMDAMGKKVGGMAKGFAAAGVALAGAFAVDQIKKAAIAGLEHASSLGEQAQQLGVSTSALQQYRYIATQVGIDQSVMDKGLAKLNITLGDLAAGAKGPTAAMKALGLSAKETAAISKMSAEEAMPLLADRFQAIESETKRAAIAADIFGSKMGGKFMTLLAGGAEELNKLTAAYKALGIEVTEGQIAKADEAMDKFAELQMVFASRQAQIAADNSAGLLKGMEQWDNFKTKSIVIFGEISLGLDRLEQAYGKGQQAQLDFYASARSAIVGWASSVDKGFKAAHDAIRNLSSSAVTFVNNMVTGIASAITGRLSAIWDGAKKKIAEIKAGFWDLAKSVVLNSYIPDMVDGIGEQMRRLDAEMVAPATKALGKTKDAFKKSADETRKIFEDLRNDLSSLMSRLFPEIVKQQTWEDESALIAAGVKKKLLTPEQAEAAQKRLDYENMGLDPVFDNSKLPTVLDDLEPIKLELLKVDGVLSNVADKTDISTGRMSKSFEDMAQDVLGSLQNLANAIKGGGFFDILAGIIDLGLQLAGAGVFGAKAQASVNTPIPGYANGTNFHPGGLAIVGERGPELVSMPRGSRVTPNSAFGQTRVQVIPSPYFDVVVDNRSASVSNAMVSSAAPRISAGTQMAATRRQQRRLA